MSNKKKKVGIIATSVLAAGLAVGGVTTGVILSTRPLNVTYYANNGTAEVTTQIKQGDIDSLPTPTREGYNFAGWYLDTGLTKQVTAKTKLKQNSKLYAGWELANYELASASTETEPLAETTGLKSIGAYAFANSKLTSVTIPDSVTTIGNGAFKNCKNLQTVTLGESLKTIGASAFYGCVGIAEINLPQNLTTIGSSAFYGCTALTGINIPNKVTSIDSSAFYGDKAIKTLTIGSSVTSIDSSAFYGCVGIMEISLPQNLTTIGSSAFYGCTGLTNINIPNKVTSIGSSAFYGCSTIKTITIGNGVTSIGGSAFYNCTALTKLNFNATNCENLYSSSNVFYNAGTSGNGITVTIGYNVTKIPAYLFYNSSSSYVPKITTLTIGSNVTNIGNSAFYNCIGLTSLAIPNNVTSIGSSAFYNCSSLNTLIIPDSVQIIGTSAFSGATSLTNLTIGSGVTTINVDAFFNCTSLERLNFNATDCNNFTATTNAFSNAGTSGDGIAVIFGDNVTKIPAYLFYNSSSSYVLPKIKSLVIGSGVTSIGNSAFRNCTLVTKIDFNAVSCDDFTSSVDIFYNVGTSGGGISVTIGDSATKIPANLFYNCAKYITSVKIGSGVTSIGDYAFLGATSLTDLTIGSSVTSIGSSAFNNCSSLTSLVIPNSVKNIKNYAFNGGTKLTAITIGSGVTSIGIRAFYNCTALTQLNFNAVSCSDFTSSSYIFYDAGSAGDGISVTFGNDVNKIPAYLFYNDSYSSHSAKITSVVMQNVVTSIGDFAFNYCSALSSIIIPDSVTSVGSSAFIGCGGLSIVTIGSGVTSIGDSAFAHCTAITELNFNAKECASFSSSGNNLFYNAGSNGSGMNVIFGNTVIKVPAYLFSCTVSGGRVMYPPKIASITFGTGVTTIGNSVFQYTDCSELTKINLNATNCRLNNINYRMFYNTKFESDIEVTIADTVTQVGAGMFAGCSAHIKKLTIGSGVTSIGQEAFFGCSLPTSIVIPNNVTSIGQEAFSFCSSVTSFVFSNKITSISNKIFRDCRSLINITIPNSVTSIGSSAFESCKSLTSIYIPSSVTNIDANTHDKSPFLYCSSNLQIRCGASSKPSGWGSQWNAYSISNKISNIVWGASS